MIATALVLGLTIGLTMGALGGGGSILAVPVLVFLLGRPVDEATTVSLMGVGLGAAVAVVGHWRAGRVRVRTGIVLGVVGVCGSGYRSSAMASILARKAGLEVLNVPGGMAAWKAAGYPTAR
ncbi:MAG: TSUP family transporter [Acidimicrobiales bacterium]